MPRARNSIPSVRNHKGSAVIDIWEGSRRRQITLGPWNSPQAIRELSRILAEQSARPSAPRSGATVAEVCLAFMKHANQHYVRPDGTHTTEVRAYSEVVAVLRELYGHTPAAEFGPLAAKTVRAEFITKGWCRKHVNAQVGRLKRIFRWAAGEELVPPTVFHGLMAVTGLQRGRSGVHDHAPVKPVPTALVDATLPFMTRHVRGLVMFQRLTGCRPGEACSFRWCDVDRTGPVWWFRPADHKLSWKEKERVIAIGPKLQAILEDFPTEDPEAFVFSPAKAMEEVSAQRSANRKTPRYASHMKRNKAKRVKSPKREARDRYTTDTYGRAIKKACERGELTVWKPHQLRHAYATEIRKLYGVEGAKTTLGHATIAMAEHYAERDMGLVERIAAQHG